jgi:hypothetical protein
MTTITEQALIDKIRTLDTDQRQQVIDFIASIEIPQTNESDQTVTNTHSARELMKLPYHERMKLARAALSRTSDDDIELFEAYEIVDDE